MGMEFELEQISPLQLEAFIKAPESFYEGLLSSSFEDSGMIEFLAMAAKLRQDLPTETKANIDRLASQLPATSPQSATGGLRRLRKLIDSKHKKPRASARMSAASVRKQLLLEKDWHVLHYVLNGTAEGGDGPIARAVLGGREIPDHQGMMGYGPVRYLDKREVEAVAAALESVAPQQLISRLNKEDAKKKRIYLAHTFDQPRDWEYLPELFERFRDFYRDAAVQGNAMLMKMY